MTPALRLATDPPDDPGAYRVRVTKMGDSFLECWGRTVAIPHAVAERIAAQSASLAAALAEVSECRKIAGAAHEATPAANARAVDAEARVAALEAMRETAHADMARQLAECEALKADRAEWERRYVEALNEIRDALGVDRFDAEPTADAARRVVAERDALRRAEAGKGAGDDGEADALELATTFHNAVAALDYRIARFADCNYLDRNRLISAAKQTFAAVVRPRLAALQAKVDAAEQLQRGALARLDEVAQAGIDRGRSWEASEWCLNLGVRSRDDAKERLRKAKAAGEGRPIHRAPATPGPLPLSGDDAWRVFNAEGTHLNGAIAVAGWAFDLGVAHGRTLAQPADAEAKRKAALEAVGDFVYGHARRISEQHNGCTDDETVRDFAVEVHDILNNLRADENAEVYDGRPGRASSSGPTSPAKPADRYVAQPADAPIPGGVAYRLAWFDSLDNARDYAGRMSRGEETDDAVRWDSWFDRMPHHVAVIIDTQPATTPQPSPRAVGVDAERLAELYHRDDSTRTTAWMHMDADARAVHVNAMRRALATIGAQPAVALTEAPLAATMAKVLSAFGEPGMTWRSEASAIVAALGPVAIPAGIDREALIAARTCVMAHGGPGMSRMVQALDGVIRAGDAGKADAVTVGIDREALTWARRYMNAETGFDKPMHVRAIAALDAIRAGQPNAVTVEELRKPDAPDAGRRGEAP